MDKPQTNLSKYNINNKYNNKDNVSSDNHKGICMILQENINV